MGSHWPEKGQLTVRRDEDGTPTGSPVVKTSLSSAKGVGSIPG